jgi:hypothetical protein
MAITAGYGTVSRYIDTAFQGSFVAAIVFFGGWALLVWLGALPMPNDVGSWWFVPPVAYGLYAALKELVFDLRSGGEFPEFFAFWGPYRTSAVLNGIAGLIIALGVAKFTTVASVPNGVKAFYVAAMAAGSAFGGISVTANKRREYPLLAAFDIILSGALSGFFVGIPFYILYIILTRNVVSEQAIAYWCCSFALLGAIVNLWRRHRTPLGIGAVLGSFFGGMGKISLKMGTTVDAIGAFLSGALWFGFAFFVIWVVYPPTNVWWWLGFSFAVVAGIKGLQEIGTALSKHNELAPQGGLGNAGNASEKKTQGALSGTGPKPPWADHGYRD